MKTAAIICEYNPIHNGHIRHISETRAMIGEDGTIVCAMSGNFVQRGELGIFEKHARAASAVVGGADLVIELPLATVLSSAEGFALGGVRLLEALGVCTHLSFGSETGETESLQKAADCLITEELSALLKDELKAGVSFAAARHKAALKMLGGKADVLKTPNNILGIEYLKALSATKSSMTPLTIRRVGAAHDSDGAESASQLRRLLKDGREPWSFMPEQSAEILRAEITAGRGPVFMDAAELALLSRLRMIPDSIYKNLPDASEGLELRLMRYARSMPTLQLVLEQTKTKRYAMSRLRRMALCAALGVQAEDSLMMPNYVRVLAFNKKGRMLLRKIKETSKIPVITKPAEVNTLNESARLMFKKEADATDFFALAYPKPENRTGGQEWTISPRVL